MKRLLAGIALAALTTGSTFAADLKAPVYKAPPTLVASTPWTGFYFGAGIGFRSTQSDPTVTDVRDAFVTLAGECARFAGQFGGCFTSEPANDTAFRVSPYFGFNWQFAPQWVAGVEGDFGFAKKTTTIFGMFYPESVFGWSGEAGDTFSVKTTWDASARGRIGYLVTPTVLAYATGGAAWLHIETTSNCNTNGLCRSALLFSPPVITDSTTRLGWTIGGGIEAALWSNWIARAEYRYADFGTITNTDFRAGGPIVGNAPLKETYDVALKTHTVTFGLAYKLGDPIATQSAAAYAAVASAPSWTGVYLGAGVGARSTTGDVVVTDATGVDLPFPTPINLSSYFRCVEGAANGRPCMTSEPINDTAFRFSPYIGYNWQFAAQWVTGIEGDFGFASKTTTLNGMFYPVTFFGATGAGEDTFSVKTTWDASVRGRIGYLVTPTIMAYGTGGAAWLHVKATSNCGTTSTNTPPFGGFCVPGSFSPPVITDSTTRLGWTIGGGIEAALWSNWIARAEYRYADFGTITNTDFRAGSPSVGGFPLAVTYNLALKTHTATFGLAYKFN